MPIIKELTTEDLLYDARENNKKLKQEIDKYKQALEEIRTLAKEECQKKCDFKFCQGKTDDTTALYIKF